MPLPAAGWRVGRRKSARYLESDSSELVFVECPASPSCASCLEATTSTVWGVSIHDRSRDYYLANRASSWRSSMALPSTKRKRTLQRSARQATAVSSEDSTVLSTPSTSPHEPRLKRIKSCQTRGRPLEPATKTSLSGKSTRGTYISTCFWKAMAHC